MMRPFDAIQELYSKHPSMDFEHDLDAHFEAGYVVATPLAFAMARPVMRHWSREMLANPYKVEALELADCWFIWALAGELSIAARWLPISLPWLGFARRGKAAKFVQTSNLIKKGVAFGVLVTP
jgi:hypothetical protein